MSTLSWFSRSILPWYRENKRPLPWRANKDPYRIWLSEVILQQTRVDQGTAYWHRFVERYPSVAELAAAQEDEVLRLWQGLGYYSRARNLLAAARQVVSDHGGNFPADHAALRQLKGVGDYTAAAIGSMAFGLHEPVVDGNVYRVLSRVFAINTPIDSTVGRREFRALAAKLVDPSHPGDHNQAMMELGAIVCTPRQPSCTECPLTRKCIARIEGRIAELPVKAGKTRMRTRHFNYLHIEVRGGTCLRKRSQKDIWHGLYELPLLESGKPLGRKALLKVLQDTYGDGWSLIDHDDPVRHVLSHQVILAVFWRVVPPTGFRAPEDWITVPAAALDRHALPRLIERYLAPTKASDHR